MIFSKVREEGTIYSYLPCFVPWAALNFLGVLIVVIQPKKRPRALMRALTISQSFSVAH